MCINTKPAAQDDKKVWIVVTVIEVCRDDDLYGDVVGVFRKEQTARELRDKLNANHPVGLVEYDHAAYFSREMDINIPMRTEEDDDNEQP
jgi:hypothetical protein